MPSPVLITTLPDTNLCADDLRELVAGVPGLLGFVPTDSLVLVTFTYTERLCLGATLRCDLPGPDEPTTIIDRLCTTAANNGAVAAVAVLVGGTTDPPDVLPHEDLVDLAADLLEDEEVRLLHAVWVPSITEGERWRCYGDDSCTGELPDPRKSILAAAATMAGVVTYRSRASLATQLAADPAADLTRRADLLNARMTTAGPPDPHADIEELHKALREAAATPELPTLTDDQVVTLATALSNPEARDDCLALALTDQAAAAERLWTVLVRATPAPERAEPALLLAIAAYLRGEGVLASMAITIALEANPGHQLAELLSMALQSGLPPAELRELLREAFTRAKAATATPPEPPTPRQSP